MRKGFMAGNSIPIAVFISSSSCDAGNFHAMRVISSVNSWSEAATTRSAEPGLPSPFFITDTLSEALRLAAVLLVADAADSDEELIVKEVGSTVTSSPASLAPLYARFDGVSPSQRLPAKSAILTSMASGFRVTCPQCALDPTRIRNTNGLLSAVKGSLRSDEGLKVVCTGASAGRPRWLDEKKLEILCHRKGALLWSKAGQSGGLPVLPHQSWSNRG